jgi:hypothetical protein
MEQIALLQVGEVPVQIQLHGVEEIQEALEEGRMDVIQPTGAEVTPEDLQEVILLTGVVETEETTP